MTSRNLVAGPWFLASVALLVINDHVLKSAAPGPITGKLSDVAGLVMTPILIVGTIEFLSGRLVTPRRAWMISALTGAAFAAIQLTPSAADAYRQVMGLVHGLPDGFPLTPADVLHVADAWDLVALPAVAVAPMLARSRARGADDQAGADPLTGAEAADLHTARGPR